MRDQRRGLCGDEDVARRGLHEDEDVAGFERCDRIRGKERAALPQRTEAASLCHYRSVQAASLLTFQSLFTSEISFLSPQ